MTPRWKGRLARGVVPASLHCFSTYGQVHCTGQFDLFKDQMCIWYIQDVFSMAVCLVVRLAGIPCSRIGAGCSHGLRVWNIYSFCWPSPWSLWDSSYGHQVGNWYSFLRYEHVHHLKGVRIWHPSSHPWPAHILLISHWLPNFVLLSIPFQPLPWQGW